MLEAWIERNLVVLALCILGAAGLYAVIEGIFGDASGLFGDGFDIVFGLLIYGPLVLLMYYVLFLPGASICLAITLVSSRKLSRTAVNRAIAVLVSPILALPAIALDLVPQGGEGAVPGSVFVLLASTLFGFSVRLPRDSPTSSMRTSG